MRSVNIIGRHLRYRLYFLDKEEQMTFETTDSWGKVNKYKNKFNTFRSACKFIIPMALSNHR